MDFLYEMPIENGKKEKWIIHIVRYKYGEDILEMYVESRSSFHVIIGKTTLETLYQYQILMWFATYQDLAIYFGTAKNFRKLWGKLMELR